MSEIPSAEQIQREEAADYAVRREVLDERLESRAGILRLANRYES